LYILEPPGDPHEFLFPQLARLLAYIGIHPNFRIDLVTPNTQFDPSWDVAVLYMPSHAAHTQDFAQLLTGITSSNYVPLVMSARAALVISQDYPMVWATFFQDRWVPRFDVSDEFLNEVDWSAPSPTLLPQAKDFITWLPEDGHDTFLFSIPFRAVPESSWRAQMSWKTGRVIAASFFGPPISIFNFDIAKCWNPQCADPPEKLANFIRFRQMALSLLSLMCESMSGLPFLVSPGWAQARPTERRMPNPAEANQMNPNFNFPRFQGHG
jgi:hypothetical protein